MRRKITIDEDEYVLYRQWLVKKIKENPTHEMIATLDYFTNVVDRGKAKSKFRCALDNFMCTYGYLTFVILVIRLIISLVN